MSRPWRVSAKDAQKFMGKQYKGGKKKRAARMPKADFEAAYAYRKKSGCWHPILQVAGRWFCADGTCGP